MLGFSQVRCYIAFGGNGNDVQPMGEMAPSSFFAGCVFPLFRLGICLSPIHDRGDSDFETEFKPGADEPSFSVSD